MFKYGLSRKQCGVIFANIKSGKLELPEDFANWMYKRIADARVFADDSVTVDVFARMKNGLDAIFAGDLAEANRELDAAYRVWHCHYREV